MTASMDSLFLLTVSTQWRGKMSSRFSRNSEAFASEFLEILFGTTCAVDMIYVAGSNISLCSIVYQT